MACVFGYLVAVLFSLSGEQKYFDFKNTVDLFHIASLRIDCSPERLGILH